MISNQLLQRTLDELKAISNEDTALFGLDGNLIVSTYKDKIDSKKIQEFAESSREFKELSNSQLFKIKDDLRDEYILAVRGKSATTELVGRMVKYQLEHLLASYKEKFDKDNFVKSLLMDNLMLVDIFDRSRKFKLEIDAPRVVFVFDLKEKNQDDAITAIKGIYRENEDLITALDKKTIILVKQFETNVTSKEIEKFANKAFADVKRALSETVTISYGSTVYDLKEVSKSYKEAKMAQEVGKIFFADSNINSYENLGIGRLIYQLPMPLCRLFIKEIFGDSSPRDFDEEITETINKFFDNSLNVSETSRQLYIHRNTLVYRLDKVQKNTGLDLRVFDDAITLKIAMMVSNYMDYVDGLEYK